MKVTSESFRIILSALEDEELPLNSPLNSILNILLDINEAPFSFEQIELHLSNKEIEVLNKFLLDRNISI